MTAPKVYPFEADVWDGPRRSRGRWLRITLVAGAVVWLLRRRWSR